MKKIFLSLALIGLLGSGAIAATRAYFSDGVVQGANTFATGTVDLDSASMSGLPLTLTNLAPGIPQTRNVNIRYLGTLNADMYLGVTGDSSTPAFYIADKLKIKIVSGSTVLFNNYANLLSESWRKIATDMSPNFLNEYVVTFTLDADAGNLYQNVENKNTVFMFYAVQTGAPAPVGAPVSQHFELGEIVNN